MNRLFRRLPSNISISTPSSSSSSSFFQPLLTAIHKLDSSRSPEKQLAKLRKHEFTTYNSFPLVIQLILALFSLFMVPSRILQFLIPLAYAASLLIPLTGQFTLPATPIFSWLLFFFSGRYIPSSYRPSIHVILLPALESIFFGANISDILTRFTHPFLDIPAWLSYGLGHFLIPFGVAIGVWVGGPRGSVGFFAKAFGWMNLSGVMIQMLVPCAAPWYEIIHGLTPANYSMPGSPGGLLRIDRIFHSSGYADTFGSAPLVFGAFPSLHSGCATMEALFLSQFFPKYQVAYWTYVGVLYWATMYLTHHYLIDVVGGGCLALGWFYYTMPKEFKDLDMGIEWENSHGVKVGGGRRRRAGGGLGAGSDARGYELAEMEDIDEEIRRLEVPNDTAPSSASSTLDTVIEIRTPVDSGARPYPPAPVKYIAADGETVTFDGEASKEETKDKEPPPGSTRASKIKPKRKMSVQWGEAEILGEKEVNRDAGVDQEREGNIGRVEEGKES